MTAFRAVGLGLALAVLAVPGAAGAEKGLGPAYNTKYESLGVLETFTTPTGSITVTAEEIQTVNCSGCDTQWLGPGVIFHIRNNTKAAVCTAFVFTHDVSDWGRERWGSGTPIYLKPGQTAKKIGGFYWINGGDLGQVSMGYSNKTYVWAPNPDKTCPKVKLG